MTKLYHGSSHKIDGVFHPILNKETEDHIHSRPAVFATERKDIASLFMFPADSLASIGFEEDIAYICIWGTREEFDSKDRVGYLYSFKSDDFEKVGKGYEWQSFGEVSPIETQVFPSVIDGLMQCGAQVYFINDDPTFDVVVKDKDNRAPLLKTLESENERVGLNFRPF